jgi:hypothetical protein
MSTARRFVGLLATPAVWALGAGHVQACPICFQVEDGPVATGVRLAVVVLIGVTLAVLAGFGAFIARCVRRARQLDETASAPDGPRVAS